MIINHQSYIYVEEKQSLQFCHWYESRIFLMYCGVISRHIITMFCIICNDGLIHREFQFSYYYKKTFNMNWSLNLYYILQTGAVIRICCVNPLKTFAVTTYFRLHSSSCPVCCCLLCFSCALYCLFVLLIVVSVDNMPDFSALSNNLLLLIW